MANVSKSTALFTGAPVFRLEMSRAEAETLAVILCKVSGHESASPRKYQMAISCALSDAGIGWSGTKPYGLVSGNISFKDYPKPYVPGYYQGRVNAKRVEFFDAEPLASLWRRVEVEPAA